MALAHHDAGHVKFDFKFALEILPLLMRGAAMTILVTLLAFALAIVGGLVLALLRRANRTLDRALRLPIEFIRSTPLLVQILFIYLGFPTVGIVLTAFQTGVLALALHYSCYLSEIYRAGLEGVQRGQWDAATALNFNTLDRYRAIVLPQMVPLVVPAAGNLLVYMFKDSPLLAAISLVELVFVASKIGAESFRYLEPMTLVGGIFLVMGLATARLVALLEGRLGATWIKR
jgi:polar amino acid transport system permease protein